jgi:HD-GYP domain-containing protein (c-di-GMP phosphodiesterase class II)
MTTDHNNTLYENIAHQSIEEDPHYVTAITEMADHKDVIASEDIYTTNGIKLITKNTIIRSSLREGLIKHKLCKPIDQSLIVQNGVTVASLAYEIARLIKENPSLQYLAAFNGDLRALPQELVLLALSPHMAFKLTVAKEQHPHLFQHLLLVTLIAHYLAVRKNLSGMDMGNLLCAALFHDLGELHINPALLNSKNHLSEIERCHIYAHPITGYLIVREVAGIDPTVSNAILQHHERQDGSGYPYGLHGDQIGTIARIVSVADVCASIFARFGSNDRLSTLMRLNSKKYDPELLSLVHEGFGRMTHCTVAANIAELPRLEAVSQLFETWSEFRAVLGLLATDSSSPPGELAFIFDRMANLRSMLFQFGFDPGSLELLVEVAMADPQIANELAAAVDELDWQFIDLEREIGRRREVIRVALNEDENHHLDNWTKELLAYLATR